MRALISVALVWLLGSLALAHAQQAAPYEAGVHYVELTAPAPTQNADKIEVAELFWYGCGHCFSLEPIIGEWKKTLPEDAYFRPVPAFFGGVWNTHGQLYYTLESLNKLDETHQAVFQAIHNEKKRLATQKEMIEFLESYGIGEKAFKRAWSSMGVRGKMAQAERLSKAYRATGVPTLVVNGKYRIEAAMVGGFEDMLKVAEYLVEQERQSN